MGRTVRPQPLGDHRVGDAGVSKGAGQFRRNGVVCDEATTALVHAATGRSVIVAIDRAGQSQVLVVRPTYDRHAAALSDGHRLVMAFRDDFGSTPPSGPTILNTASFTGSHLAKPGYGASGRRTAIESCSAQSCGRAAISSGRRRRSGVGQLLWSPPTEGNIVDGWWSILAFTKTLRA